MKTPKPKTNAQAHLNTTKYVPRIDKYYQKITKNNTNQKKIFAKRKTTHEPLCTLSGQPI